jgi:hypothetical protein
MMFVFCVLYNKGKKKSQDIQEKEVRTNYKARREKKRKKKNPARAWMFVCCVCCQVEVSATG